MVTRADLYRLIDRLPEAAMSEAERALTAIEAQESRLPAFLRNAPPSEPEPDELVALAELAADPAAGEVISDAELVRDLGL